jgi:hypothetical protein
MLADSRASARVRRSVAVPAVRNVTGHSARAFVGIAGGPSERRLTKGFCSAKTKLIEIRKKCPEPALGRESTLTRVHL